MYGRAQTREHPLGFLLRPTARSEKPSDATIDSLSKVRLKDLLRCRPKETALHVLLPALNICTRGDHRFCDHAGVGQLMLQRGFPGVFCGATEMDVKGSFQCEWLTLTRFPHWRYHAR
jgi:hypothetical protein